MDFFFQEENASNIIETNQTKKLHSYNIGFLGEQQNRRKTDK